MILPLLVIAAACWPSLLALHRYWMDFADITYTHGYMVVLISAYLVWRRLPQWPSDLRPSGCAAMALLLAGLCWALAVQAGVEALELGAIPMLLWLALSAACGWRAAQSVWFPFAFLYFAIPLWSSINGALQNATILAVRLLLQLGGVSAHFDGNQVQIPEGHFEIAGGCSGLHFFIVGLIIGALMGELRGDSGRMRLRMILVAGVLAMVGNWLRVLTIILVGHVTHMQHYIVSQSHYYFGWGVFGVMMVLFFLWERRLTVPPRAPARTIPSGVGFPGFRGAAYVVAAVCAFGILRVAASRPSTLGWLPAAAPEWVARAGRDVVPDVTGVDASRGLRFERPGISSIDYYEAVYLTQRQGKEFSAFNADFNADATVVEIHEQQADSLPLTVMRTRRFAGPDTMLAISYRVGQRNFAAALPAQVYYGFRSLLNLRSPMSTIRVWRIACADDCTSAQQAMLQFVSDSEG